jgi:hypothetical protein
MAQATTLILLPQTVGGGNNNLIRGTRQPAAAYYLANKDLQTVSWNVTSVTGLLTIQATIAEDPSANNDSDWFTVYQTSFDNTTENGYTNLDGNFVWIRAKLAGFTGGVVQNIRVSY